MINHRPRLLHLHCYGQQGTLRTHTLTTKSRARSSRCYGLVFVCCAVIVGVGNVQRLKLLYKFEGKKSIDDDDDCY